MSKYTKKKKEKSSIFKKISSLFKHGEYEIPSVIRTKLIKGLVVGAIIFLAGVISASITSSLFMALWGLILGIIISLFSYLREIRLSKKGYKIFEGECIKVEYSILKNNKKKKEPKRFIVKGYNDFYGKEVLYALPFLKGDEALEEGDGVLIYTENEPAFYENPLQQKSYIGIGGLIGYESTGIVENVGFSNEESQENIEEITENTFFLN